MDIGQFLLNQGKGGRSNEYLSRHFDWALCYCS